VQIKSLVFANIGRNRVSRLPAASFSLGSSVVLQAGWPPPYDLSSLDEGSNRLSHCQKNESRQGCFHQKCNSSSVIIVAFLVRPLWHVVIRN
jgi:hypothetical protein